MMHPHEYASTAREIMTEFAELTGLTADTHPKRYLWTDAFAVCNFLELYRQSGNEEFRSLALSLVDQVHTILGHHRDDDSRTGWISGLDEREGREHPTLGGLRIGKDLNERQPNDPFDEHWEWDRDGQYYHYLTKWLHALDCVSRVTVDSTYNLWAIELAKTAHARFTYAPTFGGQKRMYWKMSIDLSRALVPSMGHHDPLDGYVTYHEIQATSARNFANRERPNLEVEIADMARLCRGKSWATDDPLGIGGLLFDLCRVGQLIVGNGLELTDLFQILQEASLQSLQVYSRNNSLGLPARYRLAFRELGLAIGLRGIKKLLALFERESRHPEIKNNLGLETASVMRYVPLGEAIETFWLAPGNRQVDSWNAHRHINMVMLATSLIPEGFLKVV